MKKLPRLSPALWLTAKNLFTQGFGVLVFAIQAPLLGPRAFGLVSIVLMFVGFCELVLCEAASDALISIRDLKDRHFATMNSLIVTVSGVMSIAAFVLADQIARWFGEPELAALMRWMSILPVISGLAAAPTAAAKHDMQFQALALRAMVSVLLGGVVGMFLTLTGYGVWALLWQAVITRLVGLVVLWMAVPLKLRFGFTRQSYRELVQFAAPVLVSRSLSWAGSQSPRLILGLFWGATELGIFGLAARLCDILMEVTLLPRYTTSRVELRRFDGDSAGLAAAFGKVVLRTCVVCFPLAVGGAAVAPTLFGAWLDAKWHDGVVPAALLMLMSMGFVSLYCTGAVLLAMNRQKAEALSSIAQSVLSAVLVVSAAPFGLMAASAAYAARPFLLLPFAAWLLRSRLGIRSRVMFVPQGRALAAAGIMGIGVTLVRLGLEPYLRAVFLLPILIAVGAIIYATAIRSLLPEVAHDYAGKLASLVGVRLNKRGDGALARPVAPD